MAEIWVPSESVSVSQTLYADGKSAVTLSGQFIRRDLDRASAGFISPTETPNADLVLERERIDPRA